MSQQIGKFSLANRGSFVVKLQFVYQDEAGNKHHERNGTDAILLGQTATLDLNRYNLPDGALVALYAEVLLGTDNTAGQVFVFKKDCADCAGYIINGAAFHNLLTETGID